MTIKPVIVDKEKAISVFEMAFFAAIIQLVIFSAKKSLPSYTVRCRRQRSQW